MPTYHPLIRFNVPDEIQTGTTQEPSVARDLITERADILHRLEAVNYAIQQLQASCTHPTPPHDLYDGHHDYYTCPNCGLQIIN